MKQLNYQCILVCYTIAEDFPSRQVLSAATVFSKQSSQALLIACILACILASSGCAERQDAAENLEVAYTFIGSDDCQSCHVSQFDDWQSSHHQAAMQVADENTVLGDFSDASFDYYSSNTKFLTIDGDYIVRTENESGNTQDFKVTHTFGIVPLQQYLVDFPGGRKQALPYLWDTRPPEDGGQRWFHLYPDEYIEPGDELHWTGPNFNWNYACAECHSTDLKMGYDAATDAFDTTWSEISVGCEACHGPGSEHLRQANAQDFDAQHGLLLSLDDQGDASWIMNVETGIAERNQANLHPQQQAESCGRCHSRRIGIAPDYEYGKLLTATHMPAFLDEGLYFSDGGIQDEVFVYGSFLQSKMYQAGVTCSDCHNPHSGELKTGPDSNDVCAQCHLPNVFANTDHYGETSTTGQCVDCHMQARTYMGNDPRRDHFFRIPEETSHRAETFAANRSRSLNPDLLKIAADTSSAGITAASALTRLSQPYDADALSLILAALDSPDPLLRMGALRALQPMAPEARPLDGASLLADDIRSVRLEAVLAYADISDVLEIEQNRAFQRAANEYRETYEYLGSRAESQTNLANFEVTLGNTSTAIALYEKTLQRNPDFLPAYFNLADLVGRAGDNERALELLTEGVRRSPESAAFHHSIGLAKVRNGQADEAMLSLQKSVELDRNNPRYAYVFAVALNSQGQSQQAIELLTDSRSRFPDDYDISWSLVTMLLDVGQLNAAREIATDLQRDFPDDPNVANLMRSLR